MDNLKMFRNLCCVCLREDLNGNNQLTFLNAQRVEKLTYIGDSSEITRLVNEPIMLCIKCDIKLDLVYEFVVKLNSSKAKLREYAHLYRPYQVVDSNLETIDYTAQEGRSETFINIVKLEPIYEAPESPFKNGNIDNPDGFQNFDSNRLIEPKPKSKFGLKSKIKRLKDDDDDTAKPKPKKVKLDSSPNKTVIKSESALHQFKGEPSIHQIDGVLPPSPSDDSSVCYICKKKFSTRANMLRHVREHLGRRFVCNVEGCKSYFKQKSSLQAHIAGHAGLKPHECELCLKKFSQRKSLQLHLRIHSGESPYECEYCERRFNQKSNLIRHFKCHRKPAKPRQRSFNCSKCEKCLASKQSLIRHMNRHKRMDIAPMPITVVHVPEMTV